MYLPERIYDDPVNVLVMRVYYLALVMLFIAGVSCPAMAAGEDAKYSYVTVRDVNIELNKNQALIHVNYVLDDGTQLIVLLLGKQDIKNKLVKMLNYEDAKVSSIEMTHADLILDGISYTYGRGIYWFPCHKFNVVIPRLTVSSPQVTREYKDTSEFPNGIGYFSP
jgi:hypothetical protein